MSGVNADQRAFWSDRAGPLWVAQMDGMDAALQPVLDALMGAAGIAPGERVVDIGCGSGTSSLRAAEDAGVVLGLDISEPLLVVARQRAGHLAHVRFELGDAQVRDFSDTRCDCMISRFGVMFFDDSVAAFRNMAAALVPGGRMVFATWGEIKQNPFFTLPARISKGILGDTPTVDPDAQGPFSLRDPDRVSEMLQAAGLEAVSVTHERLHLSPPGDAADVAAIMGQIGPAQSVMEYFEAQADQRAKVLAAIASELRAYEIREGVRIPAEINIVTARKPA